MHAHTPNVAPTRDRAEVGRKADSEASVAQEVGDGRRRHLEARLEGLWAGSEACKRSLHTHLQFGDIEQVVSKISHRAARVALRALGRERPVAVRGVEVLQGREHCAPDRTVPKPESYGERRGGRPRLECLNLFGDGPALFLGEFREEVCLSQFLRNGRDSGLSRGQRAPVDN